MKKMMKTFALMMVVLLMSTCLSGCIGSDNGNDEDNTGSDLSDVFSISGKGTGNAKIDKVMKCLPPPERPTFIFVANNILSLQEFLDHGNDKKSAVEICVMDLGSISYYGSCGDGIVFIGDFDKEELKNNPDADYYPVDYKGFGFLCSRLENYYAVIEKDKILYATNRNNIHEMIDISKGKADSYYDVGCNESIKRTINELDMSQVDMFTHRSEYEANAIRLLADGSIEGTTIQIYPPDAYPDEAYQAELDRMEEVNSNPDINYEIISVDRKGDMVITKAGTVP